MEVTAIRIIGHQGLKLMRQEKGSERMGFKKLVTSL